MPIKRKITHLLQVSTALLAKCYVLRRGDVSGTVIAGKVLQIWDPQFDVYLRPYLYLYFDSPFLFASVEWRLRYGKKLDKIVKFCFSLISFRKILPLILYHVFIPLCFTVTGIALHSYVTFVRNGCTDLWLQIATPLQLFSCRTKNTCYSFETRTLTSLSHSMAELTSRLRCACSAPFLTDVSFVGLVSGVVVTLHKKVTFGHDNTDIDCISLKYRMHIKTQ